MRAAAAPLGPALACILRRSVSTLTAACTAARARVCVCVSVQITTIFDVQGLSIGALTSSDTIGIIRAASEVGGLWREGGRDQSWN